ncbi:zinc finger containing protein [Plasmodium cynomolgi strain B]|uniref:Zinc finger containing protein n=1 Tax=Plasmodium cynomolgi (strain B) TaxID=1120755 RepID=K6UX49_PLACD|nr:zinc finger containing protein [Plasmodium cynomolgi strain B]GAB68314.1 zinc finger containing protein [Plasmodium cynomolgi strain B]
MNEKSHKQAPQVQSETLSLIKKQFFKTKMCPFQKNKNYCLNESNCHYAHSIDELKPMPDLRNTKLCDYVKKKIPCRDDNCKFAHDIDTLKPSVHLATYKSTICSFWGKGKCFNGNKCRFAHGTEDIKTNEQIDILQGLKCSKKNKNKIKNSVTDLKQGTASTYSFDTCDYSVNGSSENTNVSSENTNVSSENTNVSSGNTNVSSENTNVSSSYDKDRDSFICRRNVIKNENTKIKSKKRTPHLDSEVTTREAREARDIREARDLRDTNDSFDKDTADGDFHLPDSSNGNSIKEVLSKIENLALSTFIENNDKYTKVIKYLLNENNLLKESIKKDQSGTLVERDFPGASKRGDAKQRGAKEGVLDAGNETHFGYPSTVAVAAAAINRNLNGDDDLTKCVLPEDDTDNYVFTNEKRNTKHVMSNFDDGIKADENLNSIIKTIDDILISQNVGSFSSVKDMNSAHEIRDAFSVNNSGEITNREYANLMSNAKSFETERSVYNHNVNLSNVAHNGKHMAIGEVQEEVSNQPFEEGIINYLSQGRKKRNCYEEKFGGAQLPAISYGVSIGGSIHSNGMHNVNKNASNTGCTNQMLDLDELAASKIFNPFAFHHNEYKSQEVGTNQQQRMPQMQRISQDGVDKNEEIDTWKDGIVMFRNDHMASSVGNNERDGDFSGVNYMRGVGGDDAANGYSSSGYATNGYAANGYAANGYAANGYAANGFSANGFSANGFSANPFATNGFASSDGARAFPTIDHFGRRGYGKSEMFLPSSHGKNWNSAKETIPNAAMSKVTTSNVTTSNVTTPKVTTSNVITPKVTTSNVNTSNVTTSILTTSNVAPTHQMQKKLGSSVTMGKEKNAKLNLREGAGAELNDSSMNVDINFPFSSDKSDFLKKIKCLISKELQYSETKNTHSNVKNVNHMNWCSENNYPFKKNTHMSDSLPSASNYNTCVPDIHNLTFLYNNNIESNNSRWFDEVNSGNNVGVRNGEVTDENGYVRLNMDLSTYKKEGNNEQNIWNANANLNEFVYPMMSHGWMNEQKSGDFFGVSKSVNLSSLN